MRKLIRNLIAWFQTFMPVYAIKFTLRGKEHTLKQSFKTLRDAKTYLRDCTMGGICKLGDDTKIVRVQ